MPPCEPPALGSHCADRSNAFETATEPGTPLRTARHACHSGAPATSTPPPSATILRSLTSGNVWKDSMDAAASVRSFEAPVSAASSAFQSDPASVVPFSSFFEKPPSDILTGTSLHSNAVSLPHSNTVSSPPGVGVSNRLTHSFTTDGVPYQGAPSTSSSTSASG